MAKELRAIGKTYRYTVGLNRGPTATAFKYVVRRHRPPPEVDKCLNRSIITVSRKAKPAKYAVRCRKEGGNKGTHGRIELF